MPKIGISDTAFDLVRVSMRLCSGVSVHAVTSKDLTRFARLRMSAGLSTHVVTVNPEIEQAAHDDSAYAEAVRQSDVRICDGVGVQLAARLKGDVVPPRVTGVELVGTLMEAALENGWKVLTVGSTQSARERFEVQLALRGVPVMTGTSMSVASIPAAAARIAPWLDDRMVVLVALGAPKQELLIQELRRLSPAAVIYVGIGGAIDYLTGEVRYAPPFVRNLGLEWLFRLVMQPRKRLRRQLRSLPRFVLREIGSAIGSSLRRS
ncbi:MAG: N-acetylmannosaminyltransferase [Gammaproteobacteria bacterium]|nr:N-acetylmannosaminyltransferase [Gammaproteobacteria bacterium]